MAPAGAGEAWRKKGNITPKSDGRVMQHSPSKGKIHITALNPTSCSTQKLKLFVSFETDAAANWSDQIRYRDSRANLKPCRTMRHGSLFPRPCLLVPLEAAPPAQEYITSTLEVAVQLPRRHCDAPAHIAHSRLPQDMQGTKRDQHPQQGAARTSDKALFLAQW